MLNGYEEQTLFSTWSETEKRLEIRECCLVSIVQFIALVVNAMETCYY